MVNKPKRPFFEETYTLLQPWNFDIVAFDPSLPDANAVIRRFDGLAQRGQMEDAYYASDD